MCTLTRLARLFRVRNINEIALYESMYVLRARRKTISNIAALEHLK